MALIEFRDVVREYGAGEHSGIRRRSASRRSRKERNADRLLVR